MIKIQSCILIRCFNKIFEHFLESEPKNSLNHEAGWDCPKILKSLSLSQILSQSMIRLLTGAC